MAGASEVIGTWEALEPLEPDWDRLWRAGSGSRGRCYSWRWVREIMRRHDAAGPPSEPWCVVLRDEAGRVVGIAPLVRERGARSRVRSLPDLVEWNHCLLHEGPVEPLARAVVHHLDREGLDGLRIRGILRGAALELVRAWEAWQWRCSVTRVSELEGDGVAGSTWWDRRAVVIPATWEAFLAARGCNYRHNLKRAWKKLERAGKVRFWRHSAGRELCGEPLSNEELRAALERVEARAWQGDRHFAPGGDGAAKIEILRAQGTLELSLLFLDDAPISYAFGCAAGRVGTLKYHGYDPERSDLSPGMITLAELVRTTCEAQHLDELNLHGSEHRYKAQLADAVESAFLVELVGMSPRGLASALSRRLRPGRRSTGRAALEALTAPEPVGAAGQGVKESARLPRLAGTSRG